MEPFQHTFIELLLSYEVLQFGDFTLKSGRRSPYFVNAGRLCTGDAIRRLGDAYAKRIQTADLGCDMVFGPSYKGVPLAVATASSLAATGNDVGFSFDRKEAKDHGEGGTFVATLPAAGQRVVIVDDVITSGRSIRESVELLRQAADVTITGVVVAVDRQERGRSKQTTLRELQHELGVKVAPLLKIRQVIEYLHRREVGGTIYVDDARKEAMEAYLAEHAGTE